MAHPLSYGAPHQSYAARPTAHSQIYITPATVATRPSYAARPTASPSTYVVPPAYNSEPASLVNVPAAPATTAYRPAAQAVLPYGPALAAPVGPVSPVNTPASPAYGLAAPAYGSAAPANVLTTPTYTTATRRLSTLRSGLWGDNNSGQQEHVRVYSYDLLNVKAVKCQRPLGPTADVGRRRFSISRMEPGG